MIGWYFDKQKSQVGIDGLDKQKPKLESTDLTLAKKIMPYTDLLKDLHMQPTDNQKLWRYMNFPKFVDLIQSRKLFMSKLSNFEDPWEGFPSKLNYSKEAPIRLVNEKGEITTYELLGTQLGCDILKMMEKGDKDHALYIRQRIFANCWHMNDGESDSQWKIYGDDFAVAIVTNFEKLKKAIHSDTHEICGSEVVYYDPSKENTSTKSVLQCAIYKRLCFEHEKEFRLLIMNMEEHDEPGILVSINIEELIEQVVVSPRAPNWFVTVVKTFMNQNGIKVDIQKSNLLDDY